jgi:hypothetical protein
VARGAQAGIRGFDARCLRLGSIGGAGSRATVTLDRALATSHASDETNAISAAGLAAQGVLAVPDDIAVLERLTSRSCS